MFSFSLSYLKFHGWISTTNHLQFFLIVWSYSIVYFACMTLFISSLSLQHGLLTKNEYFSFNLIGMNFQVLWFFFLTCANHNSKARFESFDFFYVNPKTIALGVKNCLQYWWTLNSWCWCWTQKRVCCIRKPTLFRILFFKDYWNIADIPHTNNYHHLCFYF